MNACFYGQKDVVQLLLNHSERIELNARDTIGALYPFLMARQPMKTIENVPINSETNSLRMDCAKQTSYFIYLNSVNYHNCE